MVEGHQRRRLKLSRWLLAGLALAAAVRGEEYRFRLASDPDGPGAFAVRHIFSGPLGRIWITSPQEIIRFDGKQLEAVDRRRNGADVQDVRWIAFSERLVYLRTRTAIYEFDGSFRPIVQGLNDPSYDDGPYQTMHVEASGQVWYLDGTRLMSRGTNGTMAMAVEAGEPLHSLLRNADESFWLGCGTGLCRWRPGKGMERIQAGVPAGPYLALAAHPVTKRLVARGRRHLVEESGEGVFRDTTANLGPLFGDQPEPALAFDHQHRLLTNCQRGLARREKDGWRFITAENGLTADVVRAIHVDIDGGIWVGTLDGGLFRWLGDGDWRILSHRDGLPRRGAESLVEDDSGAVWLGTLGFGVYRGQKRAGRWRFEHVASMGDRGTVYPWGGWIWAAGPTGAIRFDPKRGIVEKLLERRMGRRGIRAMAHDAQGRLWAGGSAGLFVLNDKVRPVALPAPAKAVISMARQADGTVWLATDAGLVRCGPDRLERMGPDRELRAIAFDERGRLWVGTKDRLELYQVTGRAVTLLRVDRSVPAGVPAWIRARDQALWVSTDRGIALRRGNAWLRYGTAEGLPGIGSRAFLERKDGTMLLANSGGVLEYEPSQMKFRTAPPLIQVGKPKVSGRDGSLASLLQLAPGHGSLQLPFAVLTTTLGLETPARYRLLPNPDWIPTRQQRLDIFGLPPGEYRLEIAAQGANGDWTGTPASIPIRVMPYWYQTGWARAGFVALALAMLGSLAYEYRRREQLRTWHMVQRMVDEFPTPVHIADAKGRIVFMNRQVEEAARLPRERLINRGYVEALGPEVGGILQAAFDRTWASGAEQTWEQRAPNGHLFSMIMFPLPNDQGETHSVCGVSVDITLQREYEQQLLALSAHRAELLEAERLRLSREIHDDIGQQLTVLKFAASLAKPNSAKLMDRLATIVRQADQALHSVRRLAHGLRPELLDHLGLAPAVAEEVEEFGARTGIEAVYEGPLDTPKLEPNVSLAAFRILQESLSNIARHSGASHVKVSLEVDEDVLMTIEDNGVGYRPGASPAPTGSFGLLGMRERAQSVGGTFEITPSPERGTMVQVRLPGRVAAAAAAMH